MWRKRIHRQVSGLLFDNVEPITIDELMALRLRLYATLNRAGVSSVAMVGSTGLKPMMGDIDLAVEHPKSRDDLFETLQESFQARKVGNDLVSIKYPLDKERWVQVDLMVGSIPFLTWSRAGSLDEGIKNASRALLMNTILRFASEHIPVTWENPLYDRTRYALDFGSGLYVIDQTRRGKTGIMLKEWKTLSRTFVSAEPQAILELMFGSGDVENSYSFSGIVNALKASSIWAPETRNQVFAAFIAELKALDRRHPGAYGDPKKVEQLVLG